MCPAHDHFMFDFYPSSLYHPQSKGLAVKQLEEDRVDLEQLRTRVSEDSRQIKQLEGLLENKDTEITRLTQVHISCDSHRNTDQEVYISP